MLVDFKNCLMHKFRDNAKAAADLRATIKDNLMENLATRYVNELPVSKNTITSYLVYDVAGYVAKTRTRLTQCEECKKSIITSEEKLPNDFNADAYTRARTKGGLQFVTVQMFQTLVEIEKVVSEHFKSSSHIYVNDTFQECIAKVSECYILSIFCDTHRTDNIGTLIMEYVKIRYYFESKRLRDVLLSKERTKVQASFKLAKTSHTPDVNTK